MMIMGDEKEMKLPHVTTDASGRRTIQSQQPAPATINVPTTIPKAQAIPEMTPRPAPAVENNPSPNPPAAPQRVNLDLPKVKPAPELTAKATTTVDNQATKVGVDRDTGRLVLIHPKYSKDSVRDGIKNGHLDNIAEFSRNIRKLQKAKEEADKNNAEAQKRAKRSAMIAGIGDAFSSLANLVGVSYNASNQSPVDNQAKRTARYEADRQDRLRSMQDINNNLDRLKRDQQEAKLAMQLGLAKYDANRRAQTEANKLEQDKIALRLLEAQNKANAEANKAGNDTGELAIKQSRAEQQNETDKARANYWNKKADNIGKDGTAGKGNSVTVAYEKDKQPHSFSLPAKTLYETSSRNISVLRDDIAREYGFNGWRDYQDAMTDNNKQYKSLPQSAKDDLRGLATVFNEDDAANIVNVYGVRSPRFMQLLEHAAGQSNQPSQKQAPEQPTAPASTSTKEDTNPLNGYSNRPKEENSILNSL